MLFVPLAQTDQDDKIKPMKQKFSPAAIVLGMHDALVSQTGIIAGLAFALADRYLIIMTGIISAVAAGLSMAASNYLAQKTADNMHAIRDGIVTGITYMGVSTLLLVPFVMIKNVRTAMVYAFIIAIIIILVCNWGIYKTGGKHFWRHALEMLAICAGVSIMAFIIGEFAKHALGITI